MRLNAYDWICIGIVLALFAASALLYPSLPSEVPTHWNASGEVDAYGSAGSIFIFPGIIAGIYLLFLVLPLLAVFKKNVENFRYFAQMKLGLVVFFSLFYVATLLAIFGYSFNFSFVSMVLIGALFVFIGYIIRYTKRNFFIGLRTPWTLASDLVWNRTHKVGSILMIIIGLVLVVLAFIGFSLFVVLALCIGFVIWMMVYSYLLFRKIGKSKL